jgi:hypothetical protein
LTDTHINAPYFYTWAIFKPFSAVWEAAPPLCSNAGRLLSKLTTNFMKSASELKTEIAAIIKEIDTERGCQTKESDRAVKKLESRLEYVKTCLLYIESAPQEGYLEKERSRLENRVNLFMEGYVGIDAERFSKSEVTKHRKEYEKEMGIPKLRKWLSTLNFLLK